MAHFFENRNIVITGASSGIGLEMAKMFLPYESNNILMIDINEITPLQSKAKIIFKKADVTDRAQMDKIISDFDADFPVNMVLPSAGVSFGTHDGIEDRRQIEKIFDINLNGTLNTILPVAKKMQDRKSGTIVLFSSMAGFVGWPSCPSYSATKAALRVFGEGISIAMKPHCVNVHVVCPAFIRTSMTAKHTFHMPHLMDVAPAVDKMLDAIINGNPMIVFPKITHLRIMIGQFFPKIYRRVLSRMPKKDPMKFDN